MAEFLPPSMPQPRAGAEAPARRAGPGPLARLVSIVITIGLAWALTVAVTAWLLGLFLSRG